MTPPLNAIFEEALRLTRGAERARSLLSPLIQAETGVDRVLEVVPELKPELDAYRKRLEEAIEHLTSALSVLEAKASMIGDAPPGS